MEIELVVAMVAAFSLLVVWYQHGRRSQARLAELASIACGLCGHLPVEERSASYRCPFCGYDSAKAYRSERARLVTQGQNLTLALSLLETAKIEFDCSRKQYAQTADYSDLVFQSEEQQVGPFYERYLEGMEHTTEALTSIGDLVSRFSEVAEADELLSTILVPPDDPADFNDNADRSIDHVLRAQTLLEAVRPRLVERFRAGTSTG